MCNSHHLVTHANHLKPYYVPIPETTAEFPEKKKNKFLIGFNL